MSLSIADKKQLIAKALSVDEWSILDDGMTDDSVTYRMPNSGNKIDVPEKLMKCSYVIDDKNVVTVGTPEEVIRKTYYESMPFSLANFAENEDSIICEGKLFEAGDYPDKDFAISEDELLTACNDFQPVPNDLEHKNTILDGKIGSVESVYLKGKELFGKVKIPKWLYNLHPDGIKTSLTWSRENKRIIGNALVLNPRVSDAQIVAAFTAAYDNKESETNNQDIIEKSKEANMPETGKITQETIDVTKNTFTKDEVLELIKESKAAFSNETEELRKKNQALEFSIKTERVDKQIEYLKRAGKLLPANEAIAKAIMMSGDSQVVTFDDKETNVAALFTAYVEASPVVVKFDELGKRGTPKDGEPSAEVIEMAAKMQIDPKDMMKYVEG